MRKCLMESRQGFDTEVEETSADIDIEFQTGQEFHQNYANDRHWQMLGQEKKTD